MAERSPYIVWFDGFTEADRCRVGGKNASLGTMLAAGLPVPPGFAVTTDAYETLRDLPDLVGMVRDSLDALDVEDSRRLQKVATEGGDHRHPGADGHPVGHP
jgi:pyruvate, water dikinase